MAKNSFNLQTKPALKVQRYRKVKEKQHINKRKVYETFQSYAQTGIYTVAEATALTSRKCECSVRTVANVRTFFDKGGDKIQQLEVNLNLLKKEVEEIKKQINKNKKQLNKTE